jgi:hypothetical protein
MKITGHIEKWASGILGAVSLLLLVNLVLQFNGVRAGGARPSPAYPGGSSKERPAKGSKGSDDLSRYDTIVRLDLLQELDGRPLPELPRNPFEFEAPQISKEQQMAQAAAAAAATTAPPPPPPVPEVNLKALGYAEKAGGVREAYVVDDTDVYIVHEGDSVANRYRILKITPASITVEDEPSHQSVELPIPQ